MSEPSFPVSVWVILRNGVPHAIKYGRATAFVARADYERGEPTAKWGARRRDAVIVLVPEK